MEKKLFVGGLSFSVTDDQLQELFSQVGTVESAKVISDKMTGKSRGFGFVEMSSEEEAGKAIEKFNGQSFEGRTIVVNEARPLDERPPRQGFRKNRDFRGRDRF